LYHGKVDASSQPKNRAMLGSANFSQNGPLPRKNSGFTLIRCAGIPILGGECHDAPARIVFWLPHLLSYYNFSGAGPERAAIQFRQIQRNSDKPVSANAG
jgi:hypothetical protein